VSGGGGKGGASKPGRVAGKPGRPPTRPPTRPSAVSSTLYERYKDALRRGHVAALRGRFDTAIEAYQEAAAIAPDRALPHASIGGILVKQKRPAEAVAAYERALALAPRDEAALRGLAETLIRLDRRPEAADTLERLAAALEAGGRTADATDAARRSLELAETPERRARVEDLASRLRASSPGDEAAERALSQALLALEPAALAGSAVPSAVAEETIPDVELTAAEAEPAAAEAEPEPVVAEEPVSAALVASAMETEAAPEPAATADEMAIKEPTEHELLDAEAGIGDAEAPEAEVVETAEGEPAEAVDSVEAEAADAVDAVEAEAAEAAEAVEEPPELEIQEPVGLGIALGAAGEAHFYAGELVEAHSVLLAAARAHRRADRLVAAIDACYLAIGLAPSDPELHLLLAEIYLDRGWRSQATDKLVLLARLAELDDDPATRDRLCTLATTRLPDEPRLAQLCA
jgi:Flp pilus assembly protein TadD